MSAPFVSVDIEGNTDSAIGSFPYNNKIVQNTTNSNKMKYKIIIGVVVCCLLAGGATAAGIIISQNNEIPVTPDEPIEPDNPPAGSYLYEQPPFTPKEGFEAMWWDEFDDDFDRSKWYVQPDVVDYYTVRRELQHYIDDPTAVDVYNGTLNIIANNSKGVQFDEDAPNYGDTYYTSARINTNKTGGLWNPGMSVDNSTWTTIRVEARLKTARGPGVVSAFWMLPVVNECHAEIDIFETPRCNTAHSGSWVTRDDTYHKNGFDKEETYDRFCDNYVVYAVEWSADRISFYIDDELIGTTGIEAWYGKCPLANDPLAPYADRPFYIILNVPIGTRWVGIPNNDIFPAIMSVDYVRVSGVRDT
jgi:beta-glucanase (GH16 family)